MWPLKLPYLIIELGSSESNEPYPYTVIGYPSRQYVWIMAREKTLNENIYNDILQKLEKDHLYKLDGLVKIPHS